MIASFEISSTDSVRVNNSEYRMKSKNFLQFKITFLDYRSGSFEYPDFDINFLKKPNFPGDMKKFFRFLDVLFPKIYL